MRTSMALSTPDTPAMALEIQCPGCGRTLRVANEHAGKQVRCPACQQISVAPSAGAGDPLAASAAPAESERAAWHLRTPEGQTFGPITWQEVQSWATEGRISADCRLAESDSGPWQPAAEWFPQLRTSLAPQPAPAAPTAYPWTPASPFPP